MEVSPFKSPPTSLPGNARATDVELVFVPNQIIKTMSTLSLDKRLKGAVREVEHTYAVGYAYGLSDAGVPYINVLVSEIDEPNTRSNYSLFADEKLKETCSIDNIDPEQLCAKGERVAQAIDTPIDLGTYYFAALHHAPFCREKNGKKRWYEHSFAVAKTRSDADSQLCRAIVNNFANADYLCKGKKWLEDYAEFLRVEASHEDILGALQALEEEEGEEE